jgi:hypothetical protein
LNSPGDGLEHVLQCDHALDLAVLVDHQRHVHVVGAEVLEQLHAGLGLGHEHGRLQVAGQVGLFAAQGLGQDLARGGNAEHGLGAALADREAAVLGALDLLQVDLERILDVEVDDVGARDHQRGDLPIVQAEHIAHHLVFMALDDAGVRPFGQHGLDVFFGHRRLGVVANPEQAQHQHRRQGEQPHERLGHHRQSLQRAGHHARDRLGVDLAQALGAAVHPGRSKST